VCGTFGAEVPARRAAAAAIRAAGTAPVAPAAGTAPTAAAGRQGTTRGTARAHADRIRRAVRRGALPTMPPDALLPERAVSLRDDCSCVRIRGLRLGRRPWQRLCVQSPLGAVPPAQRLQPSRIRVPARRRSRRRVGSVVWWLLIAHQALPPRDHRQPRDPTMWTRCRTAWCTNPANLTHVRDPPVVIFTARWR
jgi:hypothetical protein